MNLKLLFTAALGAATLGLAGCVDDYGYGGVSVGYGSPGYYGYGDPYYDGLGYGGIGGGYYGWYNDFYYPGSGVYVYDRYRRPFRWNDTQRRYWQGRRGGYRGQPNWGGFDRPGGRPDFGRPGQGRPDFGNRPGGGRPDWGNRPGNGRPDWNGRPGGDRGGRWNGNRGNWGDRGDRPGGWQGRPQGTAPSTPNPGAAAPTPGQPRAFRWGGGNNGGGARGGWRGRRGN